MAAKEEHNQYLPGYKSNHIKNHTWRTAENSAAHLLPRLQSMVKANPKLRLLDCGAGPGTISASLAKYIPDGEVVATDLSDEVIQRAAQHAEELGRKNMKFQAASIYELPFEDNSFDVVHATQVLVHLDQPLKAMKEMLRVCKPGGVVASREVDMYMWCCYPHSEILERSSVLAREAMKLSGAVAVDLGRRLVSLAMKAGVSRENIEASFGTWCYSSPEEREMWGGVMRDRLREGTIRPMALERKLATEEELEQMAKAWEDWIAAEDGTMGLMHGETLSTKSRAYQQ